MSASGQSIFRERWIIDSASQLQSSDQKIHGPDGDLTCLGSLRHIWQLLFYGIQKAFSHSRYRRAASPAPNAKSQEEARKPRRESPLTGGNTCHIWSRQREKNGIDRRPNRSRKLGPGAPLGAPRRQAPRHYRRRGGKRNCGEYPVPGPAASLHLAPLLIAKRVPVADEDASILLKVSEPVNCWGSILATSRIIVFSPSSRC